MLFSIGSKVRLIHTGDEGVVRAMLEHGLVEVALPGNILIPVPPDALERIESDRPSTVKAKVVPGKQQVEPLPIQPATVDSQYTILRPQGLQLAFDPVYDADGVPLRYRIYLINDTQHTFLYELRLLLAAQDKWATRGRLGARTMVEAGSLKFTEINGALIKIDCWRLLPEQRGTGRKLSRELKLKPSSFFGREQTAPYLNRKVHLYGLFSPKDIATKKESPVAKPPPEDLRSYTQRQARSRPQTWNNLQALPHEVWESAMFQNEIDLHLEKLVDDPSTIPHGKILSTQLHHFERYLAQAIRVGAERVFIIHGVGEGKLRDAIARSLRANDQVKDFKNEYHPRYGFGATEVIL